MSKDDDPLRPTLPLPDWKIRDRKLQIIKDSPITKQAAIGGGVGGILTAFMFASPFAFLGVAGLAAGGLGVYWYRELKRQEPEIARQLVHESNHAQKVELLARAQKLKDDGYESHAKVLKNFIQVKIEIEDDVHRSGEIDEAKQRIENLVDTLVADVAEQFNTLVKLDQHQKRLERSGGAKADERRTEIQKTKEHLASQIERAYSALLEIGGNVPDILDPLPEVRNGVTERLEGTISDLHIEAEVAQNVGSRMMELDAELQ